MPTSNQASDKFLQPGEVGVGDSACRFRTLLGSCVSITLWHPQRRFGAMSHFLLECEGKIFGGGNMFPDISTDAMKIGRSNGEAARRLLEAHGISIVSESLFGVGYRQILFDVRSGDVWARQVEPLPLQAAA